MNLYKALEKILNAYLKLDPESMLALKALEETCVKIYLTDLSLTFFLLFKPEAIHVLSTPKSEPQAFIKTKSVHLASSVISKQPHNLQVEGDVEIGYQVYGLFKNINIDWEEYLSHYVGDVVAHEMGNMARRFTKKMNTFKASLIENLSEYFHEETQWLPTHQELKDFYDDVGALRRRVERLEAHLKRE